MVYDLVEKQVTSVLPNGGTVGKAIGCEQTMNRTRHDFGMANQGTFSIVQ